jgi:ABC-type uncharacterized transport system substrate-binding protein
MIKSMKKTLLLSTLFAFAFSMFTTQVFAHAYHYEVQVSNQLQSNDKSQLEALKLTFLYDGEVSNVMLQDQKDLDKLAKTVMTDLGKLAYFTQAKLNGKVLEFTKPSDVRLEKVHIKPEDKKEEAFDVLQLHFTLALKTPVKITQNSEIAFDHEDPTAAAILYYESAKHISLSDNLNNDCKVSVKEKGDFKEGEFPQIIRVNCKS